jgi:RimJ/RimL family protein N-acetyltransferase
VSVELIPYTDGDYQLTVELETDPRVMAELGGPLPLEAMPDVHRKRLSTNRRGDWWLKIVPEAGGPPAGALGIWASSWMREDIHETGWMVLPGWQRRGIASAALALLLDLAREEPRFETVHAFPGVANAASNSLCRTAGFEPIEEDAGVEYAGRTLRCNHWAIDLRPGGA